MSQTKVFTATKISKKNNMDAEELCMLFCYYYPQYTFNQAMTVPLHRVIKMIDIAVKKKYEEYSQLLVIQAAVHKKNGVKQLLNKYKERIES